jgi:hypothetical protein
VDVLIVLLFVAFLVVVGVLGLRVGREVIQHHLARESHTLESRVLEEMEGLRLRLDILSHRLDALVGPQPQAGPTATEDIGADDSAPSTLKSGPAQGRGTDEDALRA